MKNTGQVSLQTPGLGSKELAEEFLADQSTVWGYTLTQNPRR
jgi:hypothetical protein